MKPSGISTSDREADTFAAWLRQTLGAAHARRTAERNAGFLLRRLQPGMSVLDAGCGPGSITLGLAEAVSPAEVIGVDVDRARIVAANRAHGAQPNLRFEQASLYDLPFEPARFDVVFAHAVFQHLEDPSAAAQELRRVLKPGGFVALADADFGGSILGPNTPMLDASLELMERVRRHSGGDPRIGRRLGNILAAAGFGDIECSASAAFEGDRLSTGRTGPFWADYFAAPEFVAQITSLGWATEKDLESMSNAWTAWSTTPGAFWARFWCEAIGRAP